jgi:hypothetical protein
MQEEDLVQVILVCPNLDFPIRLPFMQMNKLTSELLLIEIERVLQSNEQLVLDHCVQLNITKGGTGKRCDYVDTFRIDVGVFLPWSVIPTPTLLGYEDLFE